MIGAKARQSVAPPLRTPEYPNPRRYASYTLLRPLNGLFARRAAVADREVQHG